MREWDKAEQHYRAAVTLGFNLDEAHFDYGVLLGLQGKWAPAGDAYRQAIATNQRTARPQNTLGEILDRARHLAEAAEEYRQAVDSQPAFRLARFNLGRMLIALGRQDEAIVELEPLTEPRDAEAPRFRFGFHNR